MIAFRDEKFLSTRNSCKSIGREIKIVSLLARMFKCTCLRDIDPLGDDLGPAGALGVGLHEDGGDDAVGHGVELLDCGDDGGGVAIAALVAPRPHGAETLVRQDALEELLGGGRTLVHHLFPSQE